MINLVNNLINSEIINTALCTIIEGSIVQAQATAIGNFIECTGKNEILQTVGKIFQSFTTACLAIWATLNLAEAFGEISWEYTHIEIYTAVGMAGLVLSMPLIFHLVKNLSPENKGKIENFQKTYFTAIKVINIATAAIALGWFALLGIQFITPILLSSASLISSVYTLLRKTPQSSVAPSF